MCSSETEFVGYLKKALFINSSNKELIRRLGFWSHTRLESRTLRRQRAPGAERRWPVTRHLFYLEWIFILDLTRLQTRESFFLRRAAFTRWEIWTPQINCDCLLITSSRTLSGTWTPITSTVRLLVTVWQRRGDQDRRDFVHASLWIRLRGQVVFRQTLALHGKTQASVSVRQGSNAAAALRTDPLMQSISLSGWLDMFSWSIAPPPLQKRSVPQVCFIWLT